MENGCCGLMDVSRCFVTPRCDGWVMSLVGIRNYLNGWTAAVLNFCDRASRSEYRDLLFAYQNAEILSSPA